MPLPMSVPPGHMVQQILDQHGTLQHVILSLDPMASGQTTQAQVFVDGQQLQQAAAPTASYVSCTTVIKHSCDVMLKISKLILNIEKGMTKE